MPDGSFPPRLYKMDSIPTEAAYSGNSSILVEQYDRGKPVQYATPPNWEIPTDPVQTDPIHQSNGSLRPQFEGHVHKPSMEALFDVKHFNFKPDTFLQLSPKEIHTFVKLQTDDNLKELMKTPRAHLAFVITLRSYNDTSFISVDYRSRDPVEYGYSRGVPGHPLNPSDHKTIHTVRSRAISFVRHKAEKSEMTLGEFIGIHQLAYYEGEHFSKGNPSDWRTQHLDCNQIVFFCDLDNDKAFRKPSWSEHKHQLTFTSSFVEVLMYVEVFHFDLGKQNIQSDGARRMREFYYYLDVWSGRIQKQRTTDKTYVMSEEDLRLEVKVMQLFESLPVPGTAISFINFGDKDYKHECGLTEQVFGRFCNSRYPTFVASAVTKKYTQMEHDSQFQNCGGQKIGQVRSPFDYTQKNES